jgi:predicted GIY-YIG superfamily endonuclease
VTYFVYILKCKDGTLYTGIATDVERRLMEHRGKKGARYTRARGAGRIVYKEAAGTRSEALKREAEIKKWSREKKLQLTKK